jgi:Ca2+-binding RTX toxin-like protein
MKWAITALAAAMLLSTAATAQANVDYRTVNVFPRQDGGAGYELAYAAGRDFPVSVHVREDAGRLIFTSTDPVGLSGGNPTCLRVSAYRVSCDASIFTLFRFWGSPGNDALKVSGLPQMSTVAYGNAGTDVLIGGAGNDELHGGSGDDYLAGRQGTDTLLGNLGTDVCVDSGISWAC